MDQLSFLSEEPPVNPSVSPDSEAEWMMTVATWRSNILNWLNASGPSGWYGRTSPASCHQMEDGTLEPSSEGWLSSGMGSPTEFVTLNISAWPSAAAVCSLSDILETGGVQQRYFLSAKACQGILRRAEKRGKELPPQLRLALLSVAQGTSE
jgi:hypothetical protein